MDRRTSGNPNHADSERQMRFTVRELRMVRAALAFAVDNARFTSQAREMHAVIDRIDERLTPQREEFLARQREAMRRYRAG